MVRSIFCKTIRDSRYAFFWWSIGFAALSFYLMYFYPYISRHKEIIGVLDKLPPFIKNLVGDTALMATPEGFFNIQPFSMFAPLLIIIFAVAKGNDLIAGEKERNTLDLLLAHPVSRLRVIAEKFMAVVAMIMVISFVFWVSMTVAAALFSIPLNKMNLLAVITSGFMLGVVVTAITLFLSCLFLGKKRAAGVVSGFMVVTYLINAYAPMVETLKPYRYFSPFYYYNGAAPLVHGLNTGHFVILCILALLFFVASVLVFRKKDLV